MSASPSLHFLEISPLVSFSILTLSRLLTWSRAQSTPPQLQAALMISFISILTRTLPRLLPNPEQTSRSDLEEFTSLPATASGQKTPQCFKETEAVCCETARMSFFLNVILLHNIMTLMITFTGTKFGQQVLLISHISSLFFFTVQIVFQLIF